jgi:hypothetical protein
MVPGARTVILTWRNGVSRSPRLFVATNGISRSINGSYPISGTDFPTGSITIDMAFS